MIYSEDYLIPESLITPKTFIAQVAYDTILLKEKLISLQLSLNLKIIIIILVDKKTGRFFIFCT